jgi:hypothetical protein
MNNSKSNSTPTKHELCVYELLKAGTDGIHKIGKPSSAYGETCLTTTISELGLRRGIGIDRERREHIHRAGGKTYFTWYWLADRHEAEKAIRLLTRLRKKRKAKPLTEEQSDKLLSAFPEPEQSAA